MNQARIRYLWLLTFLVPIIQTTTALVCGSTTIKNHVESLVKLKNCTVVDGFVEIVLMDRVKDSDFEPYSFPALREITQYFMLYRVEGLRSLSKLFPNLEKIGGKVLFNGFALVVYKMRNFEEIGLKSLTEISRGSILILENSVLCYVETVNWKAITKWPLVKYYKKQNKPEEYCPRCPDTCPGGYCWSDSQCQMEEPSPVECHPLCNGGCFKRGPRGCYDCRGFLDSSGTCQERCPNGTYQYMDSRCVSREECYSAGVYIGQYTMLQEKDAYNPGGYFVFGDQCLESCPLGYEAEGVDCVPCKGGICEKSCSGAEIKTIQDSRALRGCTFINGSIEIVIRSEITRHAHEELERNLGAIEGIKGYLKVTRSSIPDLKFFKNLSVIQGNDSNANYALVVLDNKNIQELWDWDKKSLTVLDGKLFFHYNPKLCLQHIYKLLEVIRYEANVSDFEIGKQSNGDKFPCSAAIIEITANLKPHNIIEIHVPYLRLNYSAPVLRYVVHYSRDPYMNLTMFDDFNQCTDDGWRTKDVFVDPDDSYFRTKGFTVSLSDLEPDTHYTFYVTAYTNISIVAKSSMAHQETLPSTPSELSRFIAFSNSSTEIVLQWEPPQQINGKLEEYVVTWFLLEQDRAFIQLRDYCEHPMDYSSDTSTLQVTTPNNNNETVSCCKVPAQSAHVPKDGFEQLCPNHKASQFSVGKLKFPSCETHFHSYIYNSAFNYDSFVETTSKKTIIDSIGRNHQGYEFSNQNSIRISSKSQSHDKHFNEKGGRKAQVRKIQASSTGTTISGLKHFQDYVITVKACRRLHPKEPVPSDSLRCSKTEIAIVRTQRKESGDQITSTVLHRVDKRILTVSWSPPKSPNGLLLAFEIEYRQKYVENPKQDRECLTYTSYLAGNKEHSIHGLHPGGYEFRLRAISLSGKGPFTEYTPFTIVDTNFSPLKILFIILLMVGCLAVTCIVLYFLRSRSIMRDVIFADVNPNYHYALDRYEVDRDDVVFGQELGVGSFGKVYEGVLKPDNVRCAVKTINGSATLENESEFLSEAAVMKSMSKANFIVSLLGVVSRGRPPLVIMELMELGDLKTYLRYVRDTQPLTTATMIRIATEIADAMTFMEAHKFVHRDLAARNCMINERLTVKVGDFGMARDVYETDYYRKKNRGLLPIRWMAPESLKDGEFTTFSDIWSYGVVLWEVVTMGEQPYQGCSNDEVLHEVIDGRILDIPINCPFPLKSIMATCWRSKPCRRLGFMHIVSCLEYYHDEEFKKVAYYYSREAESLRKSMWEYVEMRSVEEPLLDKQETLS